MRCKCIVLKSLYNTLDAIVRSKREPVVIIDNEGGMIIGLHYQVQ